MQLNIVVKKIHVDTHWNMLLDKYGIAKKKQNKILIFI